jgi:hypothetical protein
MFCEHCVPICLCSYYLSLFSPFSPFTVSFFKQESICSTHLSSKNHTHLLVAHLPDSVVGWATVS